MKRFWECWVGWLERREGPEALALCRIMAGIGLVASVCFAWHHDTWMLLWLDVAHGGYRTWAGEPWLIRLLGGARPEVVLPVMVLTIACGLALSLGWRARWSAAVGLILFNSLIRINPHDGSAYDSLLTNQLFVLMWAESDATWSLTGWRRHGTWWRREQVPSWPRYVLVYQLVICYASTGWQKLGGAWLPGGDLSAVHYILQDPFWRRWDFDAWLPNIFWLTRLATSFTWWFEVLAPMLLVVLWFRATPDRPGWLRRVSNQVDWRLWFAVVGLLFHLGLHLFMRIGPFSWIILSYYPALWSGDEVRSWGYGSLLKSWKGWRFREREKVPVAPSGFQN